MTVLPALVIPRLETHLALVRSRHERDLEAGACSVALPRALSRKYRNAARCWPWQWVFPATRLHRDRESAEWRRYHLHPSAVQRAMKAAVRRSGISKRASRHTLRHSFVTQLLE